MLTKITLPARTLTDAVTLQMRDAILCGALAPGQPLWQEQLAQQFGVSRVPIREALRALSAEGLVTLHSHRSAAVTALTKTQVEEQVVIAGALDLASVARVVPRLTAGDLAKMRTCLAEMKKRESQPKEWLALNLEFHLITIRAAGWSRLESLVVESRRNIGRYVAPIYEQSVRDWDRQHRAIYRACMARDESMVKREIESHWQFTVQAITSSMPCDTVPLASGQN